MNNAAQYAIADDTEYTEVATGTKVLTRPN